jgi:non-heme chloroperoxidase
MLIHGEDDQIVPINLSSRRSVKLIKGAVERFYPGLPHGLTGTHPDIVNRDLLAFCRQSKTMAV